MQTGVLRRAGYVYPVSRTRILIRRERNDRRRARNVKYDVIEEVTKETKPTVKFDIMMGR